MNLRVYEDEDDAGVDAPTPDEQLLDVRSALLALGVREVLLASPVDAAGAVLIAEAANRAAKITDRWDLKVAAFSAAACLEGVEYGYGLRIHSPADLRWLTARLASPLPPLRRLR